MRFNPKARLDSSRVQDAGGGGARRGGGGLGGTGIGVPHVAGGGVGGIILAIVVYVIVSKVGGGSPTVGGVINAATGGGVNTSRFASGSVGLTGSAATKPFDYSTCKTGADANDSSECELVAVENSLNDYWSTEPQVRSVYAPERKIEVYHGETSTGGCGTAQTAVGPFYCSGDQTIYIDPAFYTTVGKQIGLDATQFVQAYVIAHEYGHHVQDLLGLMSKVKTQQGQNSDSVRLELQADCFAGMWAANAVKTGLVTSITQQDISQGIGAAKDVGDDYIEKTMGGSVTPDQWTHGSSAEREAWFTQGYRKAGPDDNIKECWTWSASDLTDPSSIQG